VGGSWLHGGGGPLRGGLRTLQRLRVYSAGGQGGGRPLLGSWLPGSHLYLSVSITSGACSTMMTNRGTASVNVHAANASARAFANSLDSPVMRARSEQVGGSGGNSGGTARGRG
jgi:hypothetical protein